MDKDVMGRTEGVGVIVYTGTRDELRAKLKLRDDRIAELEAAILAAKALLSPTTDDTEDAWQILDDAYHGTSQ